MIMHFNRCHGTCCALVLAWLCTAQAAEPKYDAEKLRPLVDLPVMTCDIGFNFSGDQGFTCMGEPLDLGKLKAPRTRIVELRKELEIQPKDAERRLELASLYSKIKEPGKADEMRDRALELLGAEAAAKPKDGWTRVLLARALRGKEQTAEAEKEFREAVAVSPNDWRCWNDLAGHLLGQALLAASLTNAGTYSTNFPDGIYMHQTELGKVPSRRMGKAREYLDEAEKCYDKAIACSPSEISPRLARLVARSVVRKVFRGPAGSAAQPAGPPLAELFPAEMVAELKEIAEMEALDPYAIATAAFIVALTSVPAQKDEALLEHGFWPWLPDSAKAYALTAKGHLEVLSHNPDKSIAGAACTSLGAFYIIVLADTNLARQNLTRATELRPESEAPWDMLALPLAEKEQWTELAALWEQRVKLRDSAVARIKLCKVYRRLGKFGEIEPQVQAALKLEPDNFLANTCLAVLRLRAATNELALAEVGQLMRKLKDELFSDAPEQQRTQFEFLHGLYFGIAGYRLEAASHFRRLRSADPDDERYRKACEILGL